MSSIGIIKQRDNKDDPCFDWRKAPAIPHDARHFRSAEAGIDPSRGRLRVTKISAESVARCARERVLGRTVIARKPVYRQRAGGVSTYIVTRD